MTIQILMPALSPTMEEGKLAKWLVRPGDQVTTGDIIAEIETEKAIIEFESSDGGIIREILIAEGTEGVRVNTPIAVLSDDRDHPVYIKENIPPTPPKPDRIQAKTTLPPDYSSNDTPTRTMTVREALNAAMAEEMRDNDDVFIMGEEVAEYQGVYKITNGLLDEFGSRRVIDTPVTEHGFAGIGVGAAFAGLRPVVEFMTWNFAMQAIDQIINSAAKTLYMSGGQISCPIVFRGPNGAASRVAAQHSQDYAAWYAQVPGLKVVMPYSAADARGLLKSAIRDPNPVIFLENEILYGHSFEVPDMKDFTIPIGKARISRKGDDVTIVSFGIGMRQALAAAKQLEQDGISAEVIDLRTLRPIDYDTVITSVQKTNRCITVEEGWPVCSIGNHLSAHIMTHAFDWLDAPVLNVTGKDVPMPYAANLEKLALVSVDNVIAAVHQVCYR